MTVITSHPTIQDTLYFPNYTGSLGYGLKYIKELIGKWGVVDVQDCIDTTMGLIRKGVIRNQIGFQFIFGGSHGGLIAAHRKYDLYLFCPLSPLQFFFQNC